MNQIAAAYHYRDEVLERFIPVTTDELIDDLAHAEHLTEDERESFGRVCRLVRDLYHADLHEDLRAIRRSYAPLNPEPDTISNHAVSGAEAIAAEESLMACMESVLDRANFEAMNLETLNAALASTSPYGVEVYVDMEAFSLVKLYYRGTAFREDHRRRWRRGFLRRERVAVPIYRRLVMILKPSDEADEGSSRTTPIFIKVFRNIPHSDLDTLFPNTRVRIRLADKVKLWVTGGGGTIGGLMATLTKFSATLNPLSAMLAIGGLCGVLWRQVANVLTHRTKYMAKLAKTLYFYTLANNSGAITYLVEMAEAGECKEALLAYAILQHHDAEGLEAAQIDREVEAFVAERYGVQIDFEVTDALKKLETLGLLERDGNGRLHASNLDGALRILAERWNRVPERPAEELSPAGARIPVN